MRSVSGHVERRLEIEVKWQNKQVFFQVDFLGFLVDCLADTEQLDLWLVVELPVLQSNLSFCFVPGWIVEHFTDN